jgi:hypothetical protein
MKTKKPNSTKRIGLLKLSYSVSTKLATLLALPVNQQKF